MFLKEKEFHRSSSLLNPAHSILLVVDAQERFVPTMPDMPEKARRMVLLAKTAARLKIPALVSEQYPKGLGGTLPEIIAALPAGTPVLPKMTFSAFEAPDWAAALHAAKRSQFVICGVETHVCVLQTALDLAQNLEGQIYIVEDAVTSRKPVDRETALRRMETHGIQRVTSEMVAFEWLRKAGTPEFKEIQALFK